MPCTRLRWLLVNRERPAHSPATASPCVPCKVLTGCCDNHIFVRAICVAASWLMWERTCAPERALCQRTGGFTCGWPLRHGTHLEPRIRSLLEKRLITHQLLRHWEKLFVSPTAQKPDSHIWPGGADALRTCRGQIGFFGLDFWDHGLVNVALRPFLKFGGD